MSKREPRFAVVMRRPRRTSLSVPKPRDLSPVRQANVSQKMPAKDLQRLRCGGPARLYLGPEVVLTLKDGENGTILIENSSGTDSFRTKIITMDDKVKEYRCKLSPGSAGALVYQSDKPKS